MTAIASTFFTFVALNTLMFLGMSFAKAVPWPHALHPRILRSRVGEGDRPVQATAPQRILLSVALALEPAAVRHKH